MSDVTRVLSAIEAGAPHAAAQLLPLVSDELRQPATAKMAKEPPGNTFEATALVYEAYLRLVGPADAARNGDEGALAGLVERHRDRLERLVRLRMDRRLQGRVDPADVVQDAYLAVRGKFAPYSADLRLPFFLWLRLEVGQKLVDLHRFHLGTKMRDAGQEVSLHRGALPQVTSLSLAEQLLGKLTTASQAAMRVELRLRVQEALSGMDPREREGLVLRHFEELSNAEAAQLLGIKPTAAVNRYVRALKRLKDVFQGMPGGIEGIWG